MRHKSGDAIISNHQHGHKLDQSTTPNTDTSRLPKPPTTNLTPEGKQTYDSTAIRMDAAVLKQARINLKNSNVWKDLVSKFSAEKHLARSANPAAIFDGVPKYYRKANMSLAAGDLAWDLAAGVLQLPTEENIADKGKAEECARLSDSIEDVCYAGIELGLLEPLDATKVHLEKKEAVNETLRRLVRAKEDGKKFLGSLK